VEGVDELRREVASLREKARNNSDFQDNLQGDGNIRVEGGRIIFSGVTGGTAGPTGASIVGNPGKQGVGEITGPTGSPRTGPQGRSGGIGPTGATGPKMSIVQTVLGNVAFSPMEGAEPTIFDVYRVLSPSVVKLREKFVFSALKGSLELFSVVSNRAGVINAEMDGEQVIVSGLDGAQVTIVVSGTHRRFPNVDMPLVSDIDEARSRRFWAGEIL